MTRRPGLSLTEVLVAIFIMGIGTISVLTLFPLSALNMMAAFKDDRTTQASAQAGAFFRHYWQDRHSSQKTPGTPDLDNEEFFKALDNPGAANPFGEGTGMLPISGTGQDSYPVLVDPMGYLAPRPTASSNRWLGDDGFGKLAGGTANCQTAIPRYSLRELLKVTPASQSAYALRTCTLLDGLGYDPASGQVAVAGGNVDRDMRYNWSWVVQRRSGQSRYEATLTVVVFDRRANQFAPRGGETAHTPIYAQADTLNSPNALPGPAGRVRGESRVSFNRASAPLVQKGGWLMDATVTMLDYTNKVTVPPDMPFTPPVATGLPPPRPGVRNAHFYRVVSVTDTGTSVDIELETPLKADTGDDSDSSSPTGTLSPTFRRFVAVSGVSEVFVQVEPVSAK